MLRPERMTKVGITCHQARLSRVIDALYEAKAVHLTERRDEPLEIGAPLPEHEERSRALLQLQALATLLGIARKRAKPLAENELPAATKRIAKLHAEAQSLAERQKALEAEIAAREAERRAAALARAFSLTPSELAASTHLSCFVGTVKSDEGLADRLAALTPHSSLQSADVDGERAVFLAVESGKRAEALQALTAAGFSEAALPARPGPAASIVRALETDIQRLERQRVAAGKTLARMAERERAFILAAERGFARAARKSGAPLGFGVTERTVVITGWVPVSRLAALRKRLDDLTGKRILFEELEPAEEEAGPVRLRNPAAVKPFQFLLDLYALPANWEVDPTLFLFLTFPLLFGFMLGDIGYGLVTLILFLALKRKIPAGRDLLNVMAWASLWTIAFGLVFGEFFGFESIGGVALPHLLARSESVPELITISLLIGLAHMLLGLILGFINVAHHHGWWHAVKEKGGWMLLLPGLAQLLVILGLIGGGAGAFIASWPSVPLIVAAAVGVVLLIMGEGVKGAIELPSILSNVLSYARLMALGIASVSLAIVINQFAEQFAEQGSWMFLAGVLIFAVGHVINIALGVIGPFLHSLRLHYVELFTKFFEGGGDAYRPFGAED